MTRKPYEPPAIVPRWWPAEVRRAHEAAENERRAREAAEKPREVGQVDIDRVEGARAVVVGVADACARSGHVPRDLLASWAHFVDEHDRDVWIGTSVPPASFFVLVVQEVAGGFWSATGVDGEHAWKIVPGQTDNGTRLHGTLQAAEQWLGDQAAAHREFASRGGA
jgi:hypothetical protein